MRSLAVPFHILTLTLFTENVAELTHLDQKFTVCDLGGLSWLITLPETYQKELMIRGANYDLKPETGTVIKSI